MTGSATGADEPGLGYFIWMNGNSPMAIQTDNPVAQLELQDLHNKVTRSIGNAAINYKVHRLEDLQLNANLGYDVLKSKYTKNVPDMAGMMYTSNMKDGTGLVYDSKQNKRNYLLDLYANYAHVFNEKHNFSAMAGYVGSISGRNSMQPLFLRKEKNCFRPIIMSLNITCSLFTDV